MHQQTTQRQDEWRCHCSHHDSTELPDVTSIRFVLPQAITTTTFAVSWLRSVIVSPYLPTAFVIPPDPPPRLLFVLPA
jgi:hypothetical protein